MKKVREKIYYISGMHCASCELIVEKKLLALKNIKFAEASTSTGRVLVEYQGNPPKIYFLNSLFKKEGYLFFKSPHRLEKEPIKNYAIALLVAFVVLLAFFLLNKSGVQGLINVSAKSSLFAFFLLGLVAGISSCAALVGGLLLSLAKEWPTKTPHLLFNLGRLISYGIFGALLGLIGSKLSLNFNFASVLVIFVAVIMIILGLQMLGLKYLRRFQITAPKFITHYVTDEKNFKRKYLPFVVGALTFILPCGFTLTAQSLALLSGSALQGGLIMLIFALGTLPSLLIIGLSSVKFLEKPHLSAIFVKTAGILVIIFALYNINAQFAVLGLKNINAAKTTQKQDQKDDSRDLPAIVDGKQLIKMEANSRGYEPNNFKVKVNIPVRWEITDTGTSGCTNAILSRSLFPEVIELKPNKTSIQEFTPTATGIFRFSCWMGMVNGMIEVTE